LWDLSSFVFRLMSSLSTSCSFCPFCFQNFFLEWSFVCFSTSFLTFLMSKLNKTIQVLWTIIQLHTKPKKNLIWNHYKELCFL
jgi:hypothetical protein